MNVRFRGHNYHTQIRHTLGLFTHWYNVKGFALALWRGEKYLTWVGHGDGCCEYWTPINSPEAKRALILDDTLGLSGVGEKTDAK